MDELQRLAESAGYTVAASLEQIRDADPRYQIGKGKLDELADLIAENAIEKTIFANDLTPVQAYNLAKATGVEAIDRFQLILEIFAQRAKAAEAKLQIQLARLGYELSRAKERVRLARVEEQPGFLGLGKYEVDLYYDAVKRRVNSIKEKLKKIREKRRLHRIRRTVLGFSSISLAGYTNAGKSSLFNILAKESVSVDPGLFTTLSTTTRAIMLFRRRVLLTDTVGFIEHLPLKLIEAFRSTLEETIFSDLILLVVDLSESNEDVERKLLSCLDAIDKIGAAGIPIITALNKIDLLQEGEVDIKAKIINDERLNPVPISALYNTNIDLLKKELLGHLTEYVQALFSLPVTDSSMSLLSWLFSRADVSGVEYEEGFMKVIFESIPWFAERVRTRVEQLGGIFKVNFLR